MADTHPRPDATTGDTTLGAFLDGLAAARPSPSAGAVLAVTLAGAAGLTAMGARLAGDADADGAIAATADACRHRALALADRDGQAYGQVLAARRDAAAGRSSEERTAAAWIGATEVPLEIAEVAAEVAELAGGLLERGNPNLLGDVATATDLAATAAAGAARLVRINVADGGLDHPGGPGADLLARAARACTGAASHAQRQRLP